MKTTTDEAREIRAAYKKLGWNSRMIGVRSEYFSLGSSIHVTIKDPTIDPKKAKEIAERAERIHRCEITGEILGGGNRYVSVTYSDGCKEILARRWEAQLTDALHRLPPKDRNRIEPIEGANEYGVQRDNESTAHIWGPDRCEIMFYPGNELGIREGAFHLAVLVEHGRI